jgi:hypothetical protein
MIAAALGALLICLKAFPSNLVIGIQVEGNESLLWRLRHNTGIPS